MQSHCKFIPTRVCCQEEDEKFDRLLLQNRLRRGCRHLSCVYVIPEVQCNKILLLLKSEDGGDMFFRKITLLGCFI